MRSIHPVKIVGLRTPPPPARYVPLKFLALLLCGVVTCLLFDLGAKPVAVGLFTSPWDKLAHFFLFGGLAFLGGYSATLFNLPPRILLLLSFLATLLIGVLDEWRQLNLPGRHASWDDLACDAVGALVGALLLYALQCLKQRKIRQD